MNRYPEPLHETPQTVNPTLVADLEDLLLQQHGSFLTSDETIQVQIHTGSNAVCLKAQLGNGKSDHIFELFARETKNIDLDTCLALIIDYLDATLDEFFREDRNAFFPLDFTPRSFEDLTIWVKHELRRFDCENEADKLLHHL